MKGIVGELGEMKIPLRLEVNPVKQRPYRLNPIYKQKVKEELDKMLEAGIIEVIEEYEWIIPYGDSEQEDRRYKDLCGLEKVER
jgi:hypothetical protein